MTNTDKFRPNPELRLMDQVREVLRYYHYAYRTEQSYCDWIVRFIRFHKNDKHPRMMGKKEIDSFLSYLATDRNVAISTQKQALNAIVFLYRQVLDMQIDGIDPVKSKKKIHPPVVMTKKEVRFVLNELKGLHLLIAQLLYGTGLRLMECLRLRVHDIDFDPGAAWINAISNYFTSDQASEEYAWLGMSPVMREWIGGRNAKGFRENNLTIKNKHYEATLEYLVRDLRRDKTGHIIAVSRFE